MSLLHFSVLAVLSTPLAATLAAAAPWTPAKCVLASGPDLSGNTVAVTDQQGDNRQMPFAAASLFVADDAAVKLFAGPSFTGKGHLLTLTKDTYKAVAAEGGYYVNLKDLFGNRPGNEIGSFDCTTAGQAGVIHLPTRNVNSNRIVFYNDSIFQPMGYHGNHVATQQVRLTNLDGKKLLSTHSREYWGAGFDTTMDLDTGAITITQAEYAGTPASSVVVALKGDRSNSLEYQGAIARVRKFVGKIAANDLSVPQDFYAPVPHLELNRILEVLDELIENI